MYIWYISLGMKNYRNLLYEEEPRVLPFIYIPMNLSIFLFFPVHSSTSFQSSGRVKTEITARQKHHVTSRSIPRWNTLTCRLHVCIYIHIHIYAWAGQVSIAPVFHTEKNERTQVVEKHQPTFPTSHVNKLWARLPVQRVDSIRTKRVPGTWLPGRNNDPTCIRRDYRAEGDRRRTVPPDHVIWLIASGFAVLASSILYGHARPYNRWWCTIGRGWVHRGQLPV